MTAFREKLTISIFIIFNDILRCICRKSANELPSLAEIGDNLTYNKIITSITAFLHTKNLSNFLRGSCLDYLSNRLSNSFNLFSNTSRVSSM